MGIIVTSKKGSFAPTLKPGEYVATVKSVKATESESKNAAWKDKTPQIEVTFATDEGTIKQWMNLQGYKKFDELTPAEAKLHTAGNSEHGAENYAIDKNGNRVICEERTAKCMEILGEFAYTVTGDEDQEIDILNDIVDLEVGIAVKANSDNKSFVHYTMLASRVSVEA